MHRTTSYTIIAALLLVSLTHLSAQNAGSDTDPAQVMVLGMYHFANPGKDVVKNRVADVLTPDGQAQIEEVLSLLASFKPTKIAIEAMPDAQPKFDSLYTAYRNGIHTLTRNERQQFGFRLARQFDLPKLYCIDHAADLPFDTYVTYVQENEPEGMEEFEQSIKTITAIFDSLHQHASVLQILQLMNSPEWMAFDHSFYVGMTRYGTPDQDVGSDVLSIWYDRNIRIFGNLSRITEPGDRILVLYGGGHSTILRDLIRASAMMELVDAETVLAAPKSDQKK